MAVRNRLREVDHPRVDDPAGRLPVRPQRLRERTLPFVAPEPAERLRVERDGPEVTERRRLRRRQALHGDDALRPMSRFFIERPRFAAVLSVVLSLSGAVALLNLPIAQYPQVTPPTVRAAYDYPGANAREKAEGYAKSLGFTDADIAKFRKIMLEK